jgi:hypothetical protein
MCAEAYVEEFDDQAGWGVTRNVADHERSRNWLVRGKDPLVDNDIVKADIGIGTSIETECIVNGIDNLADSSIMGLQSVRRASNIWDRVCQERAYASMVSGSNVSIRASRQLRSIANSMRTRGSIDNLTRGELCCKWRQLSMSRRRPIDEGIVGAGGE